MGTFTYADLPWEDKFFIVTVIQYSNTGATTAYLKSSSSPISTPAARSIATPSWYVSMRLQGTTNHH